MQVINILKRNIVKVGLVALTSMTVSSCALEENPPFIHSDIALGTVESQRAVLNGIYSRIVDWGGYRNIYHQSKQKHIGLFSSAKASDKNEIVSFNPSPNNSDIQSDWRNNYVVINRCNTLINELPITEESAPQSQDIIGNAYFIRAFHYFNIVRAYNKVPLAVETTTEETLHLPLSERKAIFEQIIADASRAANLMSEGGLDKSYPTKYAAEMLLGKVYMYLASSTDSNDPYTKVEGMSDSGTNYWELAYEHSSKVYGQYSLVNDYRKLWTIADGNLTTEAIFELNYNADITSNHYKQIYSPRNYSAGNNAFGRVVINPEVIDKHMAVHPNDPRIAATYLTSYTKYAKGVPSGTHSTYPIKASRAKKTEAFPYIAKYAFEDQSQMTVSSNKSFVVYRYADLLLMLSEIENERGNSGAAVGYLNEVLSRARNSAETPSDHPADYVFTSKGKMAEDLYYERRFELLAEGEDWYEARRRGFAHMQQHIITPHNNFHTFTNNDATLLDDPKCMYQPIPMEEINANQKISNDDQNLGY